MPLRKIHWTKLASNDLDGIAAYIGQDSPAAAVRVILEIIDRVESFLIEQPGSGRAGRVLGTRELVIGNLPYVVAYRVRDFDLEIIRVLHTSRRWPSDF